MIQVNVNPDAFAFEPVSTALVMIDMQRDFIEPGGFGAALGNDVTPMKAIVPAVQRLLVMARQHRLLVVHTRESHLSDLSDCPAVKHAHGLPGLRIGAASWSAASPATRSSPTSRRLRASG